LLHTYAVGDRKEDTPSHPNTTGSLKKTRDKDSTSMMVPVYVSHCSTSQEVLTYALLDTQSNVSFITEDLAQELGAPSEAISLKLSTIIDSTEFKCRLLKDLKIREFSSSSYVHVQRCYTRDELSIPFDQVPTRETAESWTHLEGIVDKMPPKQNCSIGLLLGYDCHQALQPLEVIPGNETAPFAVRTPLGWSIVGSSDRTKERNCFRVNVRECPSLKKLVDVLETDFKDTRANAPYSQEDVQFVKTMENELVQETDGHLMMLLPLKRSALS
jgi:hypothetical protein